ncbi:MAG: hypothetical protein KJ645_08350, partial [Planctomycetes bacterium]|nr:hypothetical protein [Planctomycetota bacterium]
KSPSPDLVRATAGQLAVAPRYDNSITKSCLILQREYCTDPREPRMVYVDRFECVLTGSPGRMLMNWYAASTPGLSTREKFRS